MSEASESTTTTPYDPSVQDVTAVKAFFFEEYALPVELLDAIIDFAEYWPHTTTKLTQTTTIPSGNERENRFLLRSYPVGFQPSNDDHDPGQLLPSYRDRYQNMEPKPWPPNREFPADATDDALKHWETKSVPRTKHPVRKAVFTLKSHDQGWGGGLHQRGTYNGSYTWFDVGLEKVSACRETEYLSPLLSAGTGLLEAHELAPYPQFRLLGEVRNPATSNSSPPLVCSLRTVEPATRRLSDTESEHSFHFLLNPSEMHLQKNVTASKATKKNVIVWSDKDDISDSESVDALELERQGRGRATGSGEFVRNLEMGDVITVWGKSRFPGWSNTVEEVRIDIYWAV